MPITKISNKTGLLIRNATPFKVSLDITEIDEFDWDDGNSRPDRNIKGRTLASNGIIEEREELHAFASRCMYRLHFNFDNGDSFSERFDQKLSMTHDWSKEIVFQLSRREYSLTVKATSDNEYADLLSIKVSAVDRPFHADTWMTDNQDFLKDKSLKDICILGSHDAGIGIIHHLTPLAAPGNTQTQVHKIGEQLNYGARYFDIRPIIGSPIDDYYLTGHYGYIDFLKSWQGANGQPIKEIVDEINRFTHMKKEIVILNLSHSLNTNLGNDNYQCFTQKEWDDLFTILSKINDKCDLSQFNGSLTDIKIGELTRQKSCVIMIMDEGDKKVKLPDFVAYADERFTVKGEYSNISNVDEMINDQINKMHELSSKNYFLLSWTLTQSVEQILAGEPTILELAEKANNQLRNIFNYFSLSSKCYPNIIYIDKIDSTDYARKAMEINYKLYKS